MSVPDRSAELFEKFHGPVPELQDPTLILQYDLKSGQGIFGNSADAKVPLRSIDYFKKSVEGVGLITFRRERAMTESGVLITRSLSYNNADGSAVVLTGSESLGEKDEFREAVGNPRPFYPERFNLDIVNPGRTFRLVATYDTHIPAPDLRVDVKTGESEKSVDFLASPWGFQGKKEWTTEDTDERKKDLNPFSLFRSLLEKPSKRKLLFSETSPFDFSDGTRLGIHLIIDESDTNVFQIILNRPDSDPESFTIPTEVNPRVLHNIQGGRPRDVANLPLTLRAFYRAHIPINTDA